MAAHLVFVLGGVGCNELIQVFCNPSDWIATVLVLCATVVVGYPRFDQRPALAPVTAFFKGITTGVFGYLIVFLGRSEEPLEALGYLVGLVYLLSIVFGGIGCFRSGASGGSPPSPHGPVSGRGCCSAWAWQHSEAYFRTVF